MTAVKTDGNAEETLSDLERVIRHLDHIDEQVHRLTRFLDKWEPRLEQFANPGASIRGYLGGRRGRP